MKLSRLALYLLAGSVMGNVPSYAAETKEKATPGAAAKKSVRASEPENITVHRRNGSGTAAEYRTKEASLGPLGTRSILDTPMSVMVVPHDVLVNQQTRNINDLIAFVPSAQLEMRGDPNTSRPQSRGFEGDVIANTRMDGLNMVITTPYAAEQFDSV